MNVFNQNSKEEYGGFKSLKIIPIDKILNCPNFLNNNNSSTFTFQTDAILDTKIFPIHESILLGAKPTKDKNGLIYNIQGSFEIPYPDKELETKFSDYFEIEIVAIGEKFNGDLILYGSLRFPVSFTYELKHSKKLENPTKLEAKITGRTPQKPVYL